MNKQKHARGFSLIEVLVGLFLVAVAVLGLAQVFLLSVANNRQADRVANATFLAQQQIDWLRGFTAEELDVYTSTSLESRDEVLDLNLDSTNDYRRITGITLVDGTFHVIVHVYSAEKISGLSATALLADPVRYRPRAMISTLISR
jgi:prepilin-type N-terminal cleavage/methylation domain-containing protein